MTVSKTVVIVGRPNVGKSTLFNRLTKSRDALVGDQPGLTRDRHYGVVWHKGASFIAVDTGGLELQSTRSRNVTTEMVKQADLAVDESDLVLFLVDARDGLTNEDERIANKLRKTGREMWLIAKKAEGVSQGGKLADFYELGLGDPLAISASHGDGVSDLKAEIVRHLDIEAFSPEDTEAKNHPMIAVIGRPNVGKSTLVNTIIGENRVIAFDQPGTTRDAIEINFQRDGKDYTIVDTAGVRKRGKVSEKIEKFSVIKSLQAIEKSNVVALVIDATEGVSDQDVSLAAFAFEAGRSMVVVFNKWDLVDERGRDEVERTFRRKLRFLDFAKIHRLSALNGSGVASLVRSINVAYTSSRANLPTPQLTRVLKLAVERQSPPRKGYSRPKLRYAHQGGINPPLVIVHGNSVDHVPDSYRRYLESSFTTAFKLKGTQVRVSFRQGRNPFSRANKH